MDFGYLKFTFPELADYVICHIIIAVPLSRSLDVSNDRDGYSLVTIDLFSISITIWSHDKISRAFFVIIVTFVI